MTEISYVTDARKRQQIFLLLLRDIGAAKDEIQRVAEMYPVEKDEWGYLWTVPLDYQDLTGIARIPLSIAKKAYKKFEKLCF